MVSDVVVCSTILGVYKYLPCDFILPPCCLGRSQLEILCSSVVDM